jgi:hypothetical protein
MTAPALEQEGCCGCCRRAGEGEDRIARRVHTLWGVLRHGVPDVQPECERTVSSQRHD